MQNDNDTGIVVLATALALCGVLLAGCTSNNAPIVGMMNRYYTGYQNNNAPNADSNNIGGSAGSGIVDNPGALGAALTEAGATPEDVAAAATSDTALTALIDKVAAADPAAAQTLNKLLAIRNLGRGVLNITTGDLTYERSMDAAISALMDSARSVQSSAPGEKATTGATSPDTSGTGVNVPISVTPTQ